MKAPRPRRWVRPREAGQSLLEFAVVGFVFLLTVLGLLEGAVLIYSLNALGHAVETGLRAASMPTTGLNPPADVAAVKSIVSNNAFLINLPTSNVSVELVDEDERDWPQRVTGDRVRVRADYQYGVLLRFVFPAIPAITLTTQVQTVVE
jgi:Flp pilus assembly protein TadG